MKGLETSMEPLAGRNAQPLLKALTRYEGFGNALACAPRVQVVGWLKALTRYEGFGNCAPIWRGWK